MNYSEFYKSLAERFKHKKAHECENVFMAHRLRSMCILPDTPQIEAIHAQMMLGKKMPNGVDVETSAIILGLWTPAPDESFEEELNHAVLSGDRSGCERGGI
jgi:hypothetical protein